MTERINEPPRGRCLQGAVDVRWVVVVVVASSSPHRGRSGAIRGDPGRSGAIRGRSGAIRGDPGRSKVLTDRKNSIQSPHGPQKFNPKSSRTATIQSKVLTDRKNSIQKSSRTATNQSKSRRGPQKSKVVGTVLSPVRVPQQLRSSR